MKDKNKSCPHCKKPLKYRGSHIFICLFCKYLWERTEWAKKESEGKTPKLFRKHGWRLITKNGVR